MDIIRSMKVLIEILHFIFSKRIVQGRDDPQISLLFNRYSTVASNTVNSIV